MARLAKTGKYDGVFALHEAVSNRPRIKEYLASKRRVPFADGLYRHYPELDDVQEQ